MNNNKSTDRYTINLVDKTMDLLEVLSKEGPFTLIELAERLGQPKSSLFRILLTLERRSYISRNERDDKYQIGFKLVELTRNLSSNNNLHLAAQYDMMRLLDMYGETVNLGILIEGEILYVAVLEGTHPLRFADSIGAKGPIHATAMGKAIAAFMPEHELVAILSDKGMDKLAANTITNEAELMANLQTIRERGFALDDEEICDGARCIAAPIRNRFGNIEGAISISGTTRRITGEAVDSMAEEVKQAALNISQKIGYVPAAVGGSDGFA